jgi:adenylylsulfate kinase
MIFLFTGQPHAGKTTLARYLHSFLLENSIKNTFLIDGDDLRKINNNKDYSEQGRRSNITQAFSIAKYLDSLNHDAIIALVSPYKDMREELKANSNVVEVYVHTTERRGREGFHVENYEPPTENYINIDTTDVDELSSMNELFNHIQKFIKMPPEKNELSKLDSVQKFILEGREVVLKKEDETSFVRIYNNNSATQSSEKWLLIINGNKFHTSEVNINCRTRTFTGKFEDMDIENHIVCDANEVKFKNNIATII